MEDILMEYILIKDIWKNKFNFFQKHEKYKKLEGLEGEAGKYAW